MDTPRCIAGLGLEACKKYTLSPSGSLLYRATRVPVGDEALTVQSLTNDRIRFLARSDVTKWLSWLNA